MSAVKHPDHPDTAHSLCGWFDHDMFPDAGGPPTSEHCTSGKPATFRNCGFSVPVCEEHRCRCIQGAGESHERLPPRGATMTLLDAILRLTGVVESPERIVWDARDREAVKLVLAALESTTRECKQWRETNATVGCDSFWAVREGKQRSES